MLILVRSPNWLGDAVMSFPALKALRRSFPEARVGVITRQYLASLWELNSDVDELFVIRQAKLTEIFLSLALRRKNPSIYVIFPKSFLTALCARLTCASKIIGFNTDLRSYFLTHPVAFESACREHRVKKYLRLLSPLGIRSVTFSPISITEKITSVADAILGEKNGAGFIAFNPGAFYGEAKCWPPERFIELGRILVDLGFRIVILGTKKEAHRNAKIAASIPNNVIDLSGKTSLKELVAILSVVDCLVTNDTGTLHLACLLGTPVVAIFGSTDPSITGPWMGTYKVIWHQVPCSPCFKRRCKKHSLECLTCISPTEVATKVVEIINEGCKKVIHIHIDL